MNVDDRIVCLNVGGIPYDITASLIQDAAPDSMLCALCSSTWKLNRILDPNGRIFIDRNGSTFQYILDYLRIGSPSLRFKDKQTLNSIAIEADYYGFIELRDEILNEMLVDGGVPISFGKHSWTRFRGQVREAGSYRSWGWLQQTGNAELVSSDGITFTVHQDGTYILLIRLYHVPRRQNERNFQKGGLCSVQVRHSWQRSGESFPIAHFGIWDYHDWDLSPWLATATLMEIVTLYKGDQLTITDPLLQEEVSLEAPTHNTPPHLFQSCCFIRAEGNAAARYIRKHVPDNATEYLLSHAAWTPSDLMSPPSEFVPKLSSDDTVLETPVDGTYLVFGRVAVRMTLENIQQISSSEDEPTVQCRVMLPYGHAISLIDAFRLESSRSVFHERCSEPISFLDLMHLKQGCKLDVVTRHTSPENQGTTQVPAGEIPWQSLTMMRLSPELLYDRYDLNEDGWERSIPGLGLEPEALFEARRHLLAVSATAPAASVLILAMCPPLNGTLNKVALTVNGVAVAMSLTLPESGQFHHFYEILELTAGDNIGVACWNEAFGIDGPAWFSDSDFRTCRLCAVKLV